MLMREIVVQIKSGITIIDVMVKIQNNIVLMKKIAFGILLHEVVKMINM